MSAGDPLVSVVIPVFNGAAFVAKAVESVRAQSVKDVEILVVDDGSTDGTQAVLDRLRQTHGITWFQQDHGGPARSRNRGIEVARGAFVALLDCDDIWLPEKLERQLSVFQVHPHVGLVHTDYEVVTADGTVVHRVRARMGMDPLVRGFCGGHVALPSTLIFKADLVRKIGGFDVELYGSEDSDFTIRLFEATQFECVEVPLVRKLLNVIDCREVAHGQTLFKERILASRQTFLQRLEAKSYLSAYQRSVLDREWTSFFLLKGGALESRGESKAGRACYWQAIKRSPLRIRAYTRWLRSWFCYRT